MFCSCPTLSLGNMHHAATSHPAPADTCHLKKKKKIGEWWVSSRGCPYGGGCPCLRAWMPQTSTRRAHRRNTPHAARRPPACTCTRHTRPICVQDVRLHVNSAPPINTPASQRPARHSHGTHKAKATHPQGKTAHPIQCRAKVAHPKRRRANRAFSLFRVLYK